MGVQQKVWLKALFPERPSLFALFGGAVALFGDFASFVTDAVSPPFLLFMFFGVTVAAIYLCLRHAQQAQLSENVQIDSVGNCFVCDVFRFSLCAASIFALMMFVGGGKTATESVGEMLGLIQKDVQRISKDVTDIRQTVDSVMIVEKPKTDFDSFNNAWIYQHVRRDSANAQIWIKRHYEAKRPSKIDAAELYFNIGRNFMPREQLINEMVALAKRNDDAAVMVVAARNEPNEEKSSDYYAAAKKIDSLMPFAYWDIQRQPQQQIGGIPDPETSVLRLKEEKENVDQFLNLMTQQPTSAWFYLPQHQADFETVAKTQSNSLNSSIANFERLISSRNDRTTSIRNDKLKPPPLEFSWRDNVTTDLLQINKSFVATAQRYAYRFNNGDWDEGDRIPLYHEVSRKGVFEMRWQDRDGEWFGPFTYEYDLRSTSK